MDKTRKVVPIKGKHESIPSMLADFMADESIKGIVIFTFDEDGEMFFSTLNATRSQIAYAAVVAAKEAADE